MPRFIGHAARCACAMSATVTRESAYHPHRLRRAAPGLTCAPTCRTLRWPAQPLPCGCSTHVWSWSASLLAGCACSSLRRMVRLPLLSSSRLFSCRLHLGGSREPTPSSSHRHDLFASCPLPLSSASVLEDPSPCRPPHYAPDVPVIPGVSLSAGDAIGAPPGLRAVAPSPPPGRPPRFCAAVGQTTRRPASLPSH